MSVCFTVESGVNSGTRQNAENKLRLTV